MLNGAKWKCVNGYVMNKCNVCLLSVMGTSLLGGDLCSKGDGGGVKRDRLIITLEKHTAECLMMSSDSDIDAHNTSPENKYVTSCRR